MATLLRAYDRTGNRLGSGPLPWTGLSRTIVRNVEGTVTTTVPAGLIAVDVLGEEVYLRVVENGVEAPDWYLLDDDGDDPADGGGTMRPVSVGGRGVMVCLDWAEVYPYSHVPGGPVLGLKTEYPVVDQTPGKIMKDLIERAHARGVIPHITFDFTETHDSAGQPWPFVYSRDYAPGDTLYKVLTGMGTDAWADYEMVGFTLRMYVPDTAMATDRPDVVLRLGKGVTSGPRKRSRRTMRSVMLAAGAEGAVVEIIDPDALARIGRREGYEGRGGVTDIGTLTAATEVSLSRKTKASESITLGLDPAETPPLPRPGSYVRYDQRRLTPTQYEPMRLQSIAWDYAANTLSVELADLWVDRDVRMERRVDAILNGSSANERVPQPRDGDEVSPASPQGLALVSSAYLDEQGSTLAQVTASWLAVVADEDGTVCDDLSGYQIEWEQPDVELFGQFQSPLASQTIHSWSPVAPGTMLRARIRAYDRFQNYSDWSDWEQITAGNDVTPPPKPTAPLVDNYLGLLRSRWDGGFVDGSAAPSDLDRVEVHVSTVDGFVPEVGDETTLAGAMLAPGSVFAKSTYEELQFVRLLAIDRSGNVSEPSDQVSGKSTPVVSADVFDGAIGSSKLADLAVINAKIGNLAVNDAKIGDLSVGKLTAGILSADVVLGARIATALTGSRTEMNSLGFYKWNAAGTQTVAIDDNGVLITGRFRSALSGRRVEFGVSGSVGELLFYNSTGGVQRISSSTFQGAEVLQLRGGTQSLMVVGEDNNISIWGYNSSHIYRDNWQVFQGDSNLASNQRRHMWLNNIGELEVAPQVNAGSVVVAYAPNGAPSSPRLTQFTAGGYGNSFKVYQDGRGVWTELRGWDDGGFSGLRASAFEVNSDAREKLEIRDARPKVRAARKGAPPATPFLDQVRQLRLRHYQRKAAADGQGTDRVELGLVAQEAAQVLPQIVLGDENTGMGIDTYQYTTAVAGSVQDLAVLVDHLTSQLAELRGDAA